MVKELWLASTEHTIIYSLHLFWLFLYHCIVPQIITINVLGDVLFEQYGSCEIPANPY